MFNENDVVAIVERYLRKSGWTIVAARGTDQRGPDIEAAHSTSGRLLYVEAKGETSARRGSRRFGKPFNRSQVRDHVANAFYAAAKVRSRQRTRLRPLSAIALPRNPPHEDLVTAIAGALVRLGIAVLWVEPHKAATWWKGPGNR